MSQAIRPLPARLVMVFVTLFGAGALLLFGVFLFRGPFGWVDFGLGTGPLLAWDAALVVAFCVEHSLMVRRGFRARVERIAPPHYYGAVYTLASGILLLALVALWQESTVVVVKLEGPARWIARAAFLAALPGFVWCVRSVPRFDPFGVGPIKARLRGREPRRWPLTVGGPYRWARHPQYLLVLVLVWAYPDLTADRLLLDAILTVWIVLGTVLEERDLVAEFGPDYVDYQRCVPMLIPWRGPRSTHLDR